MPTELRSPAQVPGDRARVEFEALIAEIAAEFVNLPPAELDAAITGALRSIVETLDLDRAVLWLRTANEEDFYPAQRWANDALWSALATRLRHRGIDAPPTLEHGQPVEQGSLLLREQIVAPVNRGFQSLVAGHVGPAAGGKQLKTVVKPRSYLLHG